MNGINIDIGQLGDIGVELAKKIPNEKDRMEFVQGMAQLQASVNTVEAGHSSIFVAGWRPYIGWICGANLTWLAVRFFIGDVLVLSGSEIVLPPIGDNAIFQHILMTLLGGGTATLRSFEKAKGVARQSIKAAKSKKGLFGIFKKK